MSNPNGTCVLSEELPPPTWEEAPRQQCGGTESRMQKRISFGGMGTVKLPVRLAGLLPEFSRLDSFGAAAFVLGRKPLYLHLFIYVCYIYKPPYTLLHCLFVFPS